MIESSRWKETRASSSSGPSQRRDGGREVARLAQPPLATPVVAEAAGLEHRRQAGALDRARERCLALDRLEARVGMPRRWRTPSRGDGPGSLERGAGRQYRTACLDRAHATAGTFSNS